MKGRAGGWILILGGLSIGLVLWLAPAVDASSRNDEAQAKRDFDGLVHAVSERYGIHGKSIPMVWLANLCASRVTHGGMRGMKVVEFENVPKWGEQERVGLGDLVKEKLSQRWSPVVRQHEANGEDSFVYIQNDGVQGDADGGDTRMIVVDLDGGEAGRELDMVSITVNPEQLAKWVKEQEAKDEMKRSAVGALGSE